MNITILIALFISVAATTIYTEKQKKKYQDKNKDEKKEKE